MTKIDFQVKERKIDMKLLEQDMEDDLYSLRLRTEINLFCNECGGEYKGCICMI